LILGIGLFGVFFVRALKLSSYDHRGQLFGRIGLARAEHFFVERFDVALFFG